MPLATIRAESEGFAPIDERISKYNPDPGAHPFNRYDDRTLLGNHGRPDGERYRGRGCIQLTGRANYRKCGERLGVDLVHQPELANDAIVAARILAECTRDKRRAARYAIFGGGLATARRLINGGAHGLDRFAGAFQAGDRMLA